MKSHAIGAALIVALTCAGNVAAQSDSPQERIEAVERYFQEVSMPELMADMVKEVSKQLPPEHRAGFEEMMLRNLRLDAVVTVAKQSLAKHLTVAEINTLTEFMRRPEGKSAMGKMKFYMADLMPIIQQELQRAAELTRPPQQ